MVIPYYIKQVYGVDTFYIQDPSIAQTIRSLTGKKTINIHDINALTKLGHDLQLVPYTPNA